MKNKRNILVAFDGSDSSKNALEQAIQYSKDESCELTVLTVLLPYEREVELGLVKNIKGVLRELGDKTLSSAKSIAKQAGAQIDTVLGDGSIHEAIINTAKSRNCDLIIMGRRGMTKLERALMGSVTARVIGFSPIDVLVMPDNSRIKWDKILLAVDGSKCSEIATDRAINIAQAYKGELKVVSVVDVPDAAYAEVPDAVDKMIWRARGVVKSVKDRAEKFGINSKGFIKEGLAHEEIVGAAKEIKADLIIMGSHGRTGLKRFIIGNVTEKVIGLAQCPVFVVGAC